MHNDLTDAEKQELARYRAQQARAKENDKRYSQEHKTPIIVHLNDVNAFDKLLVEKIQADISKTGYTKSKLLKYILAQHYNCLDMFDKYYQDK